MYAAKSIDCEQTGAPLGDPGRLALKLAPQTGAAEVGMHLR